MFSEITFSNIKVFITAICIFIFTASIAFSQNGNSSLFINGRTLQDSCGETIMLRGINHGSIWSVDMGIPELPELAKTNANCVRICLERKHVYKYNDLGEPLYEDLRAGQIDTVIQIALDLKMIPIVELHDFTDGSVEHSHVQRNLDSAVMFWTKPDVLTVLKKHSKFLILNIANEPEHYEDTEDDFYNACSSAVASIRAKGLKVPIMLDGMHWGGDHEFFINKGYGSNLLAGDPEHKLLFSVHAYWRTNSVNDSEMTSRFKNMYNSGLPYLIGEFAYDLGDSCKNTINYTLLMDLCQQYRIGYLYWWWGFFNESSNNCLSMTKSGFYKNLEYEGLEVAITDPNSIQKTSVKPRLLIDGNCATNITEINDNFNFSITPNPTFGTFSVNSNFEIASVKLLDILGNEVSLSSIGVTSYSFNNAGSGVYLVIVHFANGQHAYKKLIVQ